MKNKSNGGMKKIFIDNDTKITFKESKKQENHTQNGKQLTSDGVKQRSITK